MKIVKQHLLPSQYFREVYKKRNIVLHHTVSSTARSALAWWAQDPRRVATAYVIDKDGTIFEAFPPEFWAHHLGLTTANNLLLNRRSIGIEIANEGPINKLADGSCRWNFGPGAPGAIYRGVPVDKPWRGLHAWAPYTEAQYTALGELVPFLLDRFKLPATMCPNLDFDPAAPDKYAIYAHCNVRRDKTDLSPAFDFSRIKLPIPV